MKTKDAVIIFSISKNEVYKLGRCNLCGIHKVNGKWEIPNNTEVLIPVKDIQRLLYQIIRYKSNPGYVFPRDLCPTIEITRALINQQYFNGFVGEMSQGENFEEIMSNVKLTEKAFSFLLGEKKELDLKIAPSFSVIQINNQVGLVNL